MWKPRPDNELWERVCREGSSAGATLALTPETLMQLCLMLPRRFVSYLEGLANGVDESRATVQPQTGPHAVTRNRELLPLPFILPSAEDLPAHNVAGDQKTLKRSRASPVLMGPASSPQLRVRDQLPATNRGARGSWSIARNPAGARRDCLGPEKRRRLDAALRFHRPFQEI